MAYHPLMFVTDLPTRVPILRTPSWIFALPAICASFLLLLAFLQPWITLTEALRDVQAVVFKMEDRNTIPLAGFLSNFGIMAWVASSAVAGFAATMAATKRTSVMLGALAVLSLVLAVDDFFIIHERVGPILLGIPEKLFFLTYVASLLTIIVVFFTEIRRMAGGLLVVAAVFFVVSLTTDVFYLLDGVPHRILEDGAKLFGIAYWLTFCWRLSWVALHSEGDAPT